MTKLTNLVGGFFKLIIENLSFILLLVGLAFIAFSGFLFSSILGFALIGLFLIFVAWIISPTEPEGK